MLRRIVNLVDLQNTSRRNAAQSLQVLRQRSADQREAQAYRPDAPVLDPRPRSH